MRAVSVRDWWTLGVGFTLTLGYAVALAWAFETQSYNVWGSLLVAPVLAASNLWLIWWAGRRGEDPWVVKLLVVAFFLKMLGSFARYLTVFVLYGGVGDANRYNQYAVEQYPLWRQGYLLWEPGGKSGTQALELITTAVYTVIGPAPLAGFLVFASLAFWGSYLLYRAFRVGVPGGRHRLYAALVLLLPSVLFWPSSIGKEAWLMFWVGVAALGVAKSLNGHGGWLLLALAAVGTLMIRPHFTVLLAVGVLGAQLFRPTGPDATGVLRKVASLLAVFAAVVLFATQSAEFLGIEDLDATSVIDSIEWASGQTAQGGSVFEPLPLTHPLGVPAAIITMLFRPFPWEASGLPMLMQSIEGLALICLCWWQRASIARVPHLIRKNPYVAFAVIYTLAFTLAFAGFGNFGILARQRTLMLPLALVILALPTEGTKGERATRQTESLKV